MEKLSAIFQTLLAGGLFLWAVYMVIRLITGGYDAFFTVCFGAMAVLGCLMLRLSARELKGGEE